MYQCPLPLHLPSLIGLTSLHATLGHALCPLYSIHISVHISTYTPTALPQYAPRLGVL